MCKYPTTRGRPANMIFSMLIGISLFLAIPTLTAAQTAQPKPDQVKACPADIQQLHFDAMIMEGEKTQKVWYLHTNHVNPGKTCVVINSWSEAGPAGWEPMKGVHEFILMVSIDGSTQKLIGDAQSGERIYVIDIPEGHEGISWVCNHSGHFIHSGGSIAPNGDVEHNGIMKVSAK